MIDRFPALLLMIGAVVQPLLPEEGRRRLFLLWPVMALGAIFSTPLGTELTASMLDHDLVLMRMDALSRVFGIVFCLTGIIGGIYAWHNADRRQQSAALFYGAGALGVTFAGDLLTLFCFWELMAISSTLLIWARKTEESQRAGNRYILVHLFGGALLMAGIILRGDFAMEAIPQEGAGLAEWLMLLGIAVNVALPPLHAWLPDAYPRATVTGAVFLSAFTTKSAVYVLARLYPGWEILIAWGVIMALYGVVYAVLANDIRGILAYHIVSQVGYMVCGVGIGTELAINGAAAHAFCHVLYKGLLFMGMGLVIKTTGISELHRLGGFWRRQKLAVFLFMIGAFSISGFPLFNGFVSKSAIVAAAMEEHFYATGLLLLLASVGTFLHTGLKIPYFVWFGPDRGIRPEPAPSNMLWAMGIGAFLCTLLGIMPGLLYDLLPNEMTWRPYTAHHLGESIQILTFTFVAFWLLRPKLAGEPKLPVDTDYFYRVPLKRWGGRLVTAINVAFAACGRSAAWFALRVQEFLANPVAAVTGRDRRTYDSNDDRATIGVSALIALVVAGAVALWVAA
ncbi:MAG: Na(+)/H(+) antiporter subunit D [Planctomycetota bacterium]